MQDDPEITPPIPTRDRTAKTAARPGKGQGAAGLREDRLKAALKSNMARRKAQARARDAAASPSENDNENTGE